MAELTNVQHLLDMHLAESVIAQLLSSLRLRSGLKAP